MTQTSVTAGPSGAVAGIKSGLSDGYALKLFVVKASLAALGGAFELSSRYCPELQAELADWPEGLVFRMGVQPAGPYMSVRKQGKGVVYLGAGEMGCDVAILFKSLDDAMLSFTAQLGTHTSVIERRFSVHGNTADAMRIARALNIVQIYLMPLFLIAPTYKTPPVMTPAKMLIKARVIAGLGPNLIAAAFKSPGGEA